MKMELLLNQLKKNIRNQKKALIETLIQFCNIQSGSYHAEGLNLMQDTLLQAFLPLTSTIEKPFLQPIKTFNLKGKLNEITFGTPLFIQKRPHLKRRILLAGHMDTVYPKDSAFRTTNWLDEKRLQGPGVTDMKGGLVVILSALSQFEKNPIAETIGWDVFINADEEVGSIASMTFLQEIAPRYQAALLFEPALDTEGTFARHRKGSGKFTLLATGKSAHAGRSFYDGKNAITYLAKIITAIHDLNGKREGLTLNIGEILGGEAINIVAPTAQATLDIRMLKDDDAKWVLTSLKIIQKQFQETGYNFSFHGGFHRPVKDITIPTEQLFKKIQTIGERLNTHFDWQDTGGCSDGNNLSKFGFPVIDTMGVCGGNIHSKDEFILVDSLVERTLLTTLLLNDLAEGGLEELSL